MGTTRDAEVKCNSTGGNDIMKSKDLVMPTQYTAMNEEEMSQTDGGGFFSQLFCALSEIFNFNHKKSTLKYDPLALSPVRDEIVKGGIVHAGCEFSPVDDHSSKNNLGNFFDSLGSICRIFGV